MDLDIYRVQQDAYGSFGVLVVPNRGTLATVEPPWVEWSDEGRTRWPFGQPYRSCVPRGSYRLIWHHSHKYGWRWHLEGKGVSLTDQRIPQHRFACLFHPANHPDDLEGCIAPGIAMGMVVGRYGVRSSRFALESRLETWLEGPTEHALTIH